MHRRTKTPTSPPEVDSTTMLQSITPRIQQSSLSTANESPILTAKQDPIRRVKRTTPQPQLAPKSGKPQHRRHYSVPDKVLLSISGSSTTANVGANDQQVYGKAIDGSCMDATERQRHGNQGQSNFFIQQSQLEQGHPAPTSNPQYTHDLASPTIPRNPFFTHDLPHDASNFIDDLLSFGSPTPTARSPTVDARPDVMGSIDAVFSPDISARARARTFPLPDPHQHISTFDLAPLPDFTFINMSSLAMPTDDDVESFYSAHSVVSSPTFHSPAPLHSKEPGFHPPLATITDAKPVSAPSKSVPPTSQLNTTVQTKQEPNIKKEPPSDTPGLVHIAPKPGFIPPPISSTADAKPKRKKGRSVEPIPASAITETGISFEEISAYISQPSPVDGKWVCLYPECNKRFGRKENIKSHVQTHLGDRQYQCQVCSKCFVRQHDLKRHAKIHTGIKPYPCLCGNSFARHDALTRHRQRGMCVGAFEGIVKKVAKRGRPKKRSAGEADGECDDEGKEDAEEKASRKPKRTKREQSDRHASISSTASAANSSSSSSASDDGEGEESGPRTPKDLHDLSQEFDFATPTPAPDTPSHATYDSAASSAGISTREQEDNTDSTPLPFEETSPNYTPPTSPPDLYDFGDIVGKDVNIGLTHQPSSSSMGSSFNSADVNDIDYVALGLDLPDFGDGKKFGYHSESQHTVTTTCAEDFVFGQDLFTGLTALERDPSILGLAEEGLGGFIKPEMLSGSS